MHQLNEIALRIDEEGTWYYFDQILERLGLVRLFYSVLHKTDEGFALITPVEKVPIIVEDVPFAVKDVCVEEDTSITLVLNDESFLPLNSMRKIRQDNRNILYVSVFERGGYTFEARFTRSAYLTIAQYFQENSSGAFVLRSADAEFILYP